MSDAVVVAVVVGFMSLLGSLGLAYITGIMRRQDKEQDYEREDEVARKLQENTEAVAVAASITNKKLDTIDDQAKVIHTLVNSNYTQALKADRDQTAITIVVMKKVMALTDAAGNKITEEDRNALAANEAKIISLDKQLADRLRQQQVADAQIDLAQAQNQ